MAHSGYEAILQAIGKLSLSDQRRLLSYLTVQTHPTGASPRKHSVLELRGLGKQVWAGVDPDEYVHQERSSWDG